MGDKPGAQKKYFRPTDCVRRALFCPGARQVGRTAGQVCGTSLQPCNAVWKYGEAFPQVFQVNRKGCKAAWKPCKAFRKYCGAARKGCKASQKYCGRLPPVSGALQKVSEAILTVSGVVLPVSFALRNASLVTGAPGPEHGCPQPQRVADRKTGKIFRECAAFGSAAAGTAAVRRLRGARRKSRDCGISHRRIASVAAPPPPRSADVHVGFNQTNGLVAWMESQAGRALKFDRPKPVGRPALPGRSTAEPIPRLQVADSVGCLAVLTLRYLTGFRRH